MSLLETMFGIGGDDGACKFSSDRYDVTFTVSPESHDVAYAVPISAAELDALAELVRVERETPYVEDGNDSLSAALESVLEEDAIDAEAWVERMAEPRRTVEPIVETWRALAIGGEEGDEADGVAGDGEHEGEAGENEPGDGDEEANGVGRGDDESNDGERGDARADDWVADLGVTVVYLPVGMESAIASFFQLCRRRDERESDPFAFPGDVAPAAALLSRINAATERPENRVVVNTRHLPV